VVDMEIFTFVNDFNSNVYGLSGISQLMIFLQHDCSVILTIEYIMQMVNSSK